MTLTDFLLARIAEDESAATALIADGNAWAERDMTGPKRDEEYAALHIGAGRVLAECEAMRHLAWRAKNYMSSRAGLDDSKLMIGATMRDFAAIYADHPDYREEWKP